MVFKDYKFKKYTDLNIKNLLSKCFNEIMKVNNLKFLCLNLVQHMLHQIKAQQFLPDLALYQQVPSQVLKKIVKFKDFSTC